MIEKLENRSEIDCTKHSDIIKMMGFSTSVYSYAIWDMPQKLRDEVFNKKKRRNFLIAGLDPNRKYDYDYDLFIRSLHNNSKNKIFYVSSSFDSLQKTPKDRNSIRINSSLNNINPQSSIDVVIANHSLPTLNKEELITFAENAQEYLNENGVIMLSKTSEKLEEHLAQSHPTLTINPRSTNETLTIFEKFKPIVIREYNPEANVFIFQKK